MSLFRFSARKTFALVVVFCLSTAVLVIGCDSDSSPTSGNSVKQESFIPVGEWADDWDGGYKITNSTLEFDDGFGSNFKGSIKEAVDFSPDAGVLLVQITESSTPGEGGKYIGVYYKDYNETHIFLANAIDASYALILKDTLADAKSTFNVDNVGTHVTYWGTGYNK